MQETHGFQLRSHGWLISFDSVVEKNRKNSGKKRCGLARMDGPGGFLETSWLLEQQILGQKDDAVFGVSCCP